MAYQKGDAKLSRCDGYCDPDECTCQGYDARGDYRPLKDKPSVYLPHSCDRWVIGGKAEVELMIADLQDVLKQL